MKKEIHYDDNSEHKDKDTHSTHNNDETKQHLIQAMTKYLQNEGYRITEPRKLIIEAVANQVGWHVHPKSVFSYVHERDDTIGIATVYRTLKVLDDMDIMNRVYSIGAQYHEKSAPSHYHLICIDCGNIHDIKDSLPEEISEQIKKDYGFYASDISMSVYGRCSECKRKHDRKK